jgi:transposase
MSEGTGFHRAYRYRLRSNRKAEAVLRRWAGCSRKVWNLALAEQQARRERGEKYAGYVTMAKWVTAWRKATETTYLAEVPVHVLQNVVRALDGAFQRFFRKEGGYPRFKRRGDPIGLRETDVKCFAVDAANGRLRFPKVGWLRYRASRPIEGRPITVTLRAEAEGWYVSIACAFEPKALVLVHPAYTSQRCHACGHTHADNRKGEVFRCRSCGHTDHADVNAAKNILAAGHAVLAGDGQALVEGQVQSDRPVKREPTEGLRRAA